MAYITDYEYYENNQVSPQDENWGRINMSH